MYGWRVSNEKGLLARSRRAAYAEVTRVAMDLFLEQGFEETTVDQILSRSGISRRSFFRYFGTKEDVVLGDLAEQGVAMRDALEAVPLDTEPWEALHEAMRQLGALNGDPEQRLKISRMMYGTPSLRARRVEKHLHWQELLLPNIRRRLGIDEDDDSDPTAVAIVASAITCLDVAGEIWTRNDGREDLEGLYLRAVDAVRRPPGGSPSN